MSYSSTNQRKSGGGEESDEELNEFLYNYYSKNIEQDPPQRQTTQNKYVRRPRRPGFQSPIPRRENLPSTPQDTTSESESSSESEEDEEDVLPQAPLRRQKKTSLVRRT
jgi:hypothetical protein